MTGRGRLRGCDMKRRFATLLLVAVSAAPATAQWVTLPTPGIPRTPGGEPDLGAPAPRAADGHPDLSGLWEIAQVRGDFDGPDKVQPWMRTLIDERARSFFRDNPRNQCLPPGPAYLVETSGTYGLRRIVQHPGVMTMLFPDLSHRQVFTDGRELEPNPLPSWTGYSAGRWEGDTLVVESNGYNDKTWLHNRGLSHTQDLRITERYRRSDFGHMRVDITYEDPGAFESALEVVVDMVIAADDELLEIVCSEASEGLSHWTGETTDIEANVVVVDPQILARYVGTYRGLYLENLVTVEITLQDGELFMQRNNAGRIALVAQSQTTFVGRGFGYVFTIEGEGMASAVSEVHVSGAWPFRRVP